jgi:nucleoside-diphosphate-sugar epimerase
MNTLLALGFGYSASAIAAQLSGPEWRIFGTARDEGGMCRVAVRGHRAIGFDGIEPSRSLHSVLRETTHLLLSAPPGDEGDPLLHLHRDDLEAARELDWIGYLSTIGVYGDHQGAWVDETTPPTPGSARSKLRLQAENAWIEFAEAQGVSLQIFRLAGIYGPGRNALERLIAGQERRIDKPEQVFNRIHLADIVAVIGAGIRAGAISGVFNVTDDEPAAPQEVIAFAAELLGMEPPPLIPWDEAELSSMARSFYLETKRVRNRRIKDMLGVTLTYPTYREGLRALAAEMRPRPD